MDSEDDLLKTAAAGLLLEKPEGVEFKERLDTAPNGIEKIAREMASLAVDGGVIIIGIVDFSNRRSSVLLMRSRRSRTRLA
jgi:hypothetical protein